MQDDHAGHRQRMLARVKRKEHLPDQELLEVMLYPLLPRKNTNDLAHRLLSAFDSLTGVYLASFDELMQIDGVGESVATYLTCMGTLFRRSFHELNKGFESLFSTEEFIGYVRMAYAEEEKEVLDVYFLDEEGFLGRPRRYTSNEYHHVAFTTATFAKLLSEGGGQGFGRRARA